MSVKMTLEFEGLKELQKKMEELASDAEIAKVNKKVFRRAADATKPRMESHMPRSADNSKSGKRGYRPPGHARDNIPVKVTARYSEVGWTLLGDAENWFYMKFVEWGTSKQPPQDFLYNTREESEDDYSRIADEEYQAFLNEKLGD